MINVNGFYIIQNKIKIATNQKLKEAKAETKNQSALKNI